MQIVTAPLHAPPHICAVTRREDGEIVDFQVDIACSEPPHLYLHRAVVEDAARLFGMVPAKRVEVLTAEVTELGKRVDDLHDTLDLAAQFEDKINPERIAA